MLRLDGLSLGGFKSFAERAELQLPDGISCVVGPNGCGKSNIVDAITWVLGEQRARFLRGAKMEDVIFAGARSRKPAGLAEVSLRFSPRDGIEARLEAAGEPVDSRLLESLEVTRRLYRNGDSEYLINGQPSLYLVNRGDTLSKIARRTETSIEEVKQVNGLSSSRIYAGQVLRLPTSQ